MGLSSMSSTASADGPSTRPDWSGTKNYSVNLSGQTLEFSVPLKLSNDFEFIEPTNKNIYDENLYGSWSSFTLTSMYWDYKSSKILWNEMYGTLRMHVLIQRNTRNIPIKDINELKSVLTENLRKTYGIDDNKYKDDSGLGIPETYQVINIHNIDWLKFAIHGGNANADMLAYATPLSDSHSIEVYFTIIESKPREARNWYNTCLNDIDRIMDSFKLSHPGE